MYIYIYIYKIVSMLNKNESTNMLTIAMIIGNTFIQNVFVLTSLEHDVFFHYSVSCLW